MRVHVGGAFDAESDDTYQLCVLSPHFLIPEFPVTVILLEQERQMKIAERDGGFQITLSKRELVTIGNCLNEACEFVPHAEFEIRVGAPLSEALELLEQLFLANKQASSRSD